MVIFQAPLHLRPYIDFFWHTDEQSNGMATTRVKLIPDGKHGIIIQHHDGRPVITEQNGNLLPAGFLYGQSSMPFINYIHGSLSVFGVFFKTHAVKEIFKIDADEIVDSYVDLDELAGYSINEQLVNLRRPSLIYDHLCNFFWKKLNDYGKADKLIEHSFSSILQNIDRISTDALYKAYPISKRQFQRRFKERAGIPPGTYIRVLKFQRSLQWMHNGKFTKLSDIAYGLGYADQSHFIKDFKHFSGHTPKEITNKEVIIPENAFTSSPLLQTRRHIYF